MTVAVKDGRIQSVEREEDVSLSVVKPRLSKVEKMRLKEHINLRNKGNVYNSTPLDVIKLGEFKKSYIFVNPLYNRNEVYDYGEVEVLATIDISTDKGRFISNAIEEYVKRGFDERNAVRLRTILDSLRKDYGKGENLLRGDVSVGESRLNVGTGAIHRRGESDGDANHGKGAGTSEIDDYSRSYVTPQMDREYEEAYKSGNTAKAMKMISAAFEAAYPYNTLGARVFFKGEDEMEPFGKAVAGYFTDDEDFAAHYGHGNVGRFFLNMENPYEYDFNGAGSDGEHPGFDGEWRETSGVCKNADREAEEKDLPPYDGYILRDVDEYGFEYLLTDDYIVKDPKNVKSAEPFTFDGNGNLVPLSQRFNPDEEDISLFYLSACLANFRERGEKGLSFHPAIAFSRERGEKRLFPHPAATFRQRQRQESRRRGERPQHSRSQQPLERVSTSMVAWEMPFSRSMAFSAGTTVSPSQ